MSGSFVQGLLFPSPVHKWRVVCAVVLLLVSLGGGARSEPFLVDDGGMLLPLRFVVQSLGGQVDMLPFHGIKSVNVTLDERTARVDYLPTNEYKRAAHTTKFCLTLDGNVGYVPLEFFPEELGVRPIFDAKRNRIVIDHPSTGRGLTLFGDSGLPDEAVIKQFFQAIRNGNDRKVGSLLGKYPALVNGREWGLTPLHVAALHGRLDAGRLLLLGQANPNAPTTGSHLTPMHYAARSGNVEMLRQLLQLGGRVNTCYRDRAGSGTPLDEAVGAGHCEAALLLMDKGAAIRGHVLTRAVCRNDRGIVSAALEHGWNIDSECAPPPSSVLFCISPYSATPWTMISSKCLDSCWSEVLTSTALTLKGALLYLSPWQTGMLMLQRCSF